MPYCDARPVLELINAVTRRIPRVLLSLQKLVLLSSIVGCHDCEYKDFWLCSLTPFSLVYVYRRFRATDSLHLLDDVPPKRRCSVCLRQQNPEFYNLNVALIYTFGFGFSKMLLAHSLTHSQKQRLSSES